MSQLRRQRCFNHAHREAAANCRTCGRHFCRECVTFVTGKMVCSRCLHDDQASVQLQSQRTNSLIEMIVLLIGFLITWGLVAGIGQVMISIPAHYHDASIWEESFPD